MTETNPAPPGPLVSTEWLAGHLGHPHLVVLDASWYLPATGRDAAAEYLAAHIPGALRFDIDALSDPVDPLPHMLLPPGHFATAMSALGVGDADTVVVYDGSGANLSAARAWWTLRQVGHDAVAVLDGGIGKWRAEGRLVSSGDERRAKAAFTARPRPDWVLSRAQVRENLTRQQFQLVDARIAPRYLGTQPEPRPGLRSGHVPGSLNLPYPDLVAADGTLRPPPELAQRLAAAGVSPERPVAAYCGSGVTACAVLLALETLGRPGQLLYDGSWTEWGSSKQ
jgi:thiosulfate/3-mercaptopyruvate sulfurtransferase